jgi:zinc/manganese transport system substrate-binding protein
MNLRYRRIGAALALALSLLVTRDALAVLSVFACEPEWGALVRELGGADLQVYVATTALQDPHHVQARPSLIAKLRRADLAVCTGAELEIGWMPVLLRQAHNPAIQPGRPGYFAAADQVHMREVPSRLDRSEGDVHPYGNPHIQTDPRNIAAVAKALASRLAELDPGHADTYRQRYEDFDQRWRAAMARWEEQGAALKGLPIVVQHKSWTYLSHWLGLYEVAALERKPGVPPSSAYLAEVLAQLRSKPGRLVIRAAYQDPRASTWLSEHADIPAVELPFTVGGLPGTDDLFGLFDVTLARLLEAAK